MEFTPQAFIKSRIETSHRVRFAIEHTQNLTHITPDILKNIPEILPILRMTTCPPIARDRLIGLAHVSTNLIQNMEINQRIPPKMDTTELHRQLTRIGHILEKLSDPDIIVWKSRNDLGTEAEIQRASVIISDRLCGSLADPLIRNAQEKRQLEIIKRWLEEYGYREVSTREIKDLSTMRPGTFSFRANVPIILENGKHINMPIDAVIKSKLAATDSLPILLEAKSAGDFTNTNKRRKEEALKYQQLRRTYGNTISFNLFLCGYFDAGYLGYEAAEGIDWIWEHRVNDLRLLGI